MRVNWIIFGGAFFSLLFSLNFLLIFEETPPAREKSIPTVFSFQTLSPRRVFSELPPQLSAKSALVVDYTSGMILFEKNPQLQLPPFSLTKLMTAIVASENCKLEDAVKVKRVQGSGTQMGLAIGDNVSVLALLYGLLLPSGNDAADALAQGCADSVEDFVYSMNLKVDYLGMKNTHFTNSSGLESKNHYSTAKDLILLAQSALSNSLISEIVETKEKEVLNVSGDKRYSLKNINRLLWEEGVFGVKTGRGTSGENLILGIERDSHKIIIIVLSSGDRFSEAEKISDWIFKSYRWSD